jgi:hypothetical protein
MNPTLRRTGPPAAFAALCRRSHGPLAAALLLAPLALARPAVGPSGPAQEAIQSGAGTQLAGQGAPSDPAPAAGPAAVSPTGRQVLRYVRLRSGGVTARNIYDVQGLPLLELEGGALAAVYSERSGWLEVEVPGGFPVWVFGRFLRATERTGVFEVTNNDVYMRPTPDTGAASYPVGRKLQAGDRLTAIAFADPEAPLADTWVRVWSPPGVGAWIQDARTEPLAPGEDGDAAWNAAEAALAATVPAGGGAALGGGASGLADAGLTEGSMPAVRISAREAALDAASRAREALQAARQLLEIERAKPVADFEAVREALRGVLQMSGEAALATAVAQELEKVDLLQELARTNALLQERERQRQEAVVGQGDQLFGRSEVAPTAAGQLRQRGIVETYRAASGASAHRLMRGGEVAAELACDSGRYDLALFLGAEVEYLGTPSGAALMHPGVPRVEVERIYVFAAQRTP